MALSQHADSLPLRHPVAAPSRSLLARTRIRRTLPVRRWWQGRALAQAGSHRAVPRPVDAASCSGASHGRTRVQHERDPGAPPASHSSTQSSPSSLSRRGCLVLGQAVAQGVLAQRLAATLPAGGAAGEASALAPVLVTGASSGIGQACARALVAAGYAVVLGCRTPEKASAERARLLTAFPEARVTAPAAPLELADLGAVSAFALELRDSQSVGANAEPGLAGLLLCAGVDGIPAERTAQGLEQHMCINHLSGFLLVAELRPLLARAPRGSRVVTLTSSAALDCDPRGVEDINWARRPVDRRQAYCLSKACCVLAADGLARRATATQGAGEEGSLRACSVDPGPCATQIVRYSQPQRARQRLGMSEEQLAKQAQQLGLRTPQEGAALPAAFARGGPGPAGEQFVNGGMYLSAAAVPGAPVPLWGAGEQGTEWRTPEAAESVWQQSMELVEAAASRDATFA